MNIFSAEELAESLLILFDSTPIDGEIGEDIHFPTEGEIFELSTRNDDVEHISPEDLVEGHTFIPEEPLAVVWNTVEDEQYCRT